MERDDNINSNNSNILISTHTLTWSVTFSPIYHVNDLKISTHTLTWSVTLWKLTCRSTCSISTHTLTWSVTEIVRNWINAQSISTHTLTWSVTLSIIYLSSKIVFQLTRSRGAWLPPPYPAVDSRDFNSHAHVERDVGSSSVGSSSVISTHTLTWSVTVIISTF